MFDQEPQDIFAGTDKAPAQPAQSAPGAVERASVAPAPRPAPAVSSAPQYAPPPAPESSLTSHLARNLMIIAFAVVLVGVGAYLAYALMIKPMMNAGVAPVLPGVTTPTADSVDDEVAEVPVEVPAEQPVVAPEELNPTFLDTDGDGLNNAAELEAGTSATSSDTDGDGLGDREEAKVYGTDPNRTDTDGDGYLDGAEVSGGFNPNGPGTLLQIPTSP